MSEFCNLGIASGFWEALTKWNVRLASWEGLSKDQEERGQSRRSAGWVLAECGTWNVHSPECSEPCRVRKATDHLCGNVCWVWEETKCTRKLKGSRTPYHKDATKKSRENVAGPFPKLLRRCLLWHEETQKGIGPKTAGYCSTHLNADKWSQSTVLYLYYIALYINQEIKARTSFLSFLAALRSFNVLKN